MFSHTQHDPSLFFDITCSSLVLHLCCVCSPSLIFFVSPGHILVFGCKVLPLLHLAHLLLFSAFGSLLIFLFVSPSSLCCCSAQLSSVDFPVLSPACFLFFFLLISLSLCCSLSLPVFLSACSSNYHFSCTPFCFSVYVALLYLPVCHCACSSMVTVLEIRYCMSLQGPIHFFLFPHNKITALLCIGGLISS